MAAEVMLAVATNWAWRSSLLTFLSVHARHSRSNSAQVTPY